MNKPNSGIIDDVLVTPQKIIDVPGGDIYHIMKKSGPGCVGFGEAYFSSIKYNVVKAWKRHRQMTLNLVVPHGCVRFVIFDDRPGSRSNGVFQIETLSMHNYHRLTIPPRLWVGFQGIDTGASLLLNIADIEHDNGEVDRKKLENFEFDWEKL